MKIRLLLTALGSVILTILITMISHAAIASTQIRSRGEQTYRVEYNEHGALLTPVGGEIYLGRGCDAYSPSFGRGTWGQANGGLRVELTPPTPNLSPGGVPSIVIGFPRQNIDLYTCSL